MASMIEENKWKSFRNSLDKSDRKTFDDMFAISHLYNSVCSYSAKYIRILMLLTYRAADKLRKTSEQTIK